MKIDSDSDLWQAGYQAGYEDGYLASQRNTLLTTKQLETMIPARTVPLPQRKDWRWWLGFGVCVMLLGVIALVAVG